MSSDEIKAEILKKEKLLELLNERLVRGEISEQTYTALKKEYEEKIASLKNERGKELEAKDALSKRGAEDIVTYAIPQPSEDVIQYTIPQKETSTEKTEDTLTYALTKEEEKTLVEVAPATTPVSTGVRRCIIKPFSLQGAEIKAKGDITPVADVFNGCLAATLAKKGMQVENMPTNISPGDFVIEGRFVKINAGSRALRYVSGVGGGATIEVEGQVVQGNRQITDLHEKYYWWAGGIFGGSDEFVLKGGASMVAGKIAKQVLKAIE